MKTSAHPTPPMAARKAIILAAGKGTRLGSPDPKPLTILNDQTFLHRLLDNFAAVDVAEAVIVVGHQADRIRDEVGQTHGAMAITYIYSDRYDSTNNAYSLWLAREHMDEPVYVAEADVVFDGSLLPALANVAASAAIAVSPWAPHLDGSVVALEPDGKVGEFLVGAQPADVIESKSPLFKTVNISLLSGDFLINEFVPRLNELILTGGENSYYELVLAAVVNEGSTEIAGVDCGHLPWYEIDNLTDLDAARYLFSTSDDRLSFLMSQYGGFWRHDVVDHYLLYNLHFPTDELLEKLSKDFRDAIVHYPIGHAPLQRLLGAAIHQPAERLVLANGASELIKIVGTVLGRVAVVVPGFNEYESVLGYSQIERIELAAPAFILNADELLSQVSGLDVNAVVITSPNNPTALAVPKQALRNICSTLRDRGIALVVDESFVDFCEEDQSLEDAVGDFENLIIIKSMSKAYGIGGLRLGYLLAQESTAARFRAEMPIWNINGLAEVFLRILPNFRRQFNESCVRVREDREKFRSALTEIPDLLVYPSEANYIMVRLPEYANGPAICSRLFADHRILTKHCAGKSMPQGEQYLRIACRSQQENKAFAEALEALLNDARSHEGIPALAGANER